MTPAQVQALRALRDCGVIRAPWQSAYGDLIGPGLAETFATTTPCPPGSRNFRLTDRGKRYAEWHHARQA